MARVGQKASAFTSAETLSPQQNRLPAFSEWFPVGLSQRMKKLSDAQIERELRKGAAELRSLRRLVFVNRKGKVIVIK